VGGGAPPRPPPPPPRYTCMVGHYFIEYWPSMLISFGSPKCERWADKEPDRISIKSYASMPFNVRIVVFSDQPHCVVFVVVKVLSKYIEEMDKAWKIVYWCHWCQLAMHAWSQVNTKWSRLISFTFKTSQKKLCERSNPMNFDIVPKGWYCDKRSNVTIYTCLHISTQHR
jgi:hypothetical protein